MAGVFISVIARLVTDVPSQPDERDTARLYMAVAAEMYAGGYKGQLNLGMSSFKKLTSEYQAFNLITVSAAQMQATPPPVADSVVAVSFGQASW